MTIQWLKTKLCIVKGGQGTWASGEQYHFALKICILIPKTRALIKYEVPTSSLQTTFEL